MDMVTHISRYQYANTYIIYVLTVEIDSARTPTHLAHDDHIHISTSECSTTEVCGTER